MLAGRYGPVRKANVAPPDASLRRCKSAPLYKDQLLAERLKLHAPRGFLLLVSSNLALARKEFHRARFAEVQAHRIVCSLGGFFGPGFGRSRPLLNFA
jgi:hypothetical protein